MFFHWRDTIQWSLLYTCYKTTHTRDNLVYKTTPTRDNLAYKTTRKYTKSSKCNISISNGRIAFAFYTEVKYLKLHKQKSVTRLTPKLHSLKTLLFSKSLKCIISMNNGPIALKFCRGAVSIEECMYRVNMAHMVKSRQLRANIPKNKGN